MSLMTKLYIGAVALILVTLYILNTVCVSHMIDYGVK